ncbi:UPF0690 protein C1orf52 homolog [Corticium candelabrum]|uniref:UPF0690 protein C1orf52 homolog n=1 Tax=Corticium candelabrum TaxID=121492 RepID=UPI002E2578F1|nr:UPF0690 protein C1orf52 homolog [Corticium candelabrum]
MVDQLGFFSVEATSSSESDDEEEDREEREASTKGDKEKSTEVGDHSNSDVSGHSQDDDGKLPSPDTLFKTVKCPEFLKTTNDIDWYDMIMKRDHDSDAFYALSSVPPPPSLASEPIRYSSGDKRPQSVLDNLEEEKVNPEVENKPKKEKTTTSKEESFKKKEKRKRDLGQASRGKNYVEEEKRILREGYSSGAGLGFD